jgi:hypothetical protein
VPPRVGRYSKPRVSKGRVAPRSEILGGGSNEKFILFDFDGVIADSYAPALEEAIKLFESAGFTSPGNMTLRLVLK